uniref:Putative zinc-finger domain-containing protein n=1 Tax=Sphaeramia orbicularis TaxID=375764 RepID=A0A673AAP5_9TELE
TRGSDAIKSGNRSPTEEGELEDGEICDDETEESVPIRLGDGSRPGGGVSLRTRKPHQHPRNMPPHIGHQPQDFRLLMPFNLGPLVHGPFPPSHRHSGPDRPPSPPPPLLPLPLTPPPGLVPHGEPSPRSNFWERSHGALGRFRHRAMPNGGRGEWNRGNRGEGNTRGLLGRYGPGEIHGNKKDSPSRKQKPLGRNQSRKPAYNVAKSENSVDESFEDLLSKYKQIQLELECIRKEETMALEPKVSPARDVTPDNTTSVGETKPETVCVQSPAGTEEIGELEKEEKKVFQAFNIKPLRQKIPIPPNLDELKKKWAEQNDTTDGEKEGELPFFFKNLVADQILSQHKVEEEELSELQLRLLALQSASKKWQQKEQQVMKKSKDRITKAAQEKTSTVRTGSAAKQAFRKQQLRTWKWKLQQQREQEENRRLEEEERRKREEEIRRIRDLSNQDEQYNRFMKLVGGKTRTRSKSRDREHRKSTGKQGLDTSGNLYQYDNYDEVAMDTDSETNSPGVQTDFPQSFSSPMLSGLPPPPPPLPPPPDEQEPPPKPPFADEEEEEEMLLRETCLMSMANKRVADKTSSGPPSPSSQPAAGVQQPPRGNLSTVSLNTVPQPRTNKFTRGHHVPRLPRHKSVVVSLNDSDDSDSDMDACSSTQAVFGGLEFMIKEARRTVEAAKPKGASGSEKENNPVRTPEALPEAKKAEYRLLKEEIASREKQKMLNSHSSRSSASPVFSDSVIDSLAKSSAELKLTEAEQKLTKHRELLQRDEAVLRHLLQQELKKRDSLKAAVAKMAKLKEQLQASEKIVIANRTLLKKLQEQVLRVEHRVSTKKTIAVKLEQELAQAQMAVGKGTKRRQDSNQIQRLDGAPSGSGRHFAELIAQKQRLQQLESEYALKIQKLKETQALRNKGAQNQLPPVSSPFPLPQPSLHDLTQDKLTLDSEDIAEADESESTCAPAPATKGTRRHSFRQSNSFTKPNLEQVTATPAKDNNTAKPAKSLTNPKGPAPPAEMFAGLDVDALKQRYQQQARLGELLLRELSKVGENVLSVEVDAATTQTGNTDLKPVPFGPYHSPLLVFRSYRFSPYYRTKEKLSLSSVTYSNTIEPKKCFCRFDLMGTCNDDDCQWQHMRNCTLTGNQLFQDILSYNLPLISCSESSSDGDISAATEKYIKKLFGTNKDRMGIDQKAVLLVSKVNESKRHVPPYTTWKDRRRWKPKPSHPCKPLTDNSSTTPLSALDVCVTSEDKRYFISETDDISNLEMSVLESPCDTQLWIKLAFRYLNQNDTSAAECLEAALNTLSRALESNCDNPEVWSHYLSLFSRRGSREEVQEMCEMAVEHAPDYHVWWNYLNLESSFDRKDNVSERLLEYLLNEASSGVTDKLSFQLMEALLYRVQLNLLTGRMENTLVILQNALKSAYDRSIADHLTPRDRALVWLSYIHLTEFDRLPSSLYDPADSGPSRLVSREPFLLPWKTPQDISTPLDILIALFEDAINHCIDDTLSQSERTLACLPLHTNLILLNKILEKFDEGILLCESLLEFCPESCILRDALADLHIGKGDGGQAVSMWLHALAECPNNAEVFYHSCKFLMAQVNEQGQRKPVDVLRYVIQLHFTVSHLKTSSQEKRRCLECSYYMSKVLFFFSSFRHILGFPTEELLQGPIIKKEFQEQLGQHMPYLHLVHCCWQWLHGSVEDTVDAFERALGSPMQLEELHKLWMDYLVFSSSQQASAPNKSQPKLFSDLVQRCLSTVPSRLEVPFNPAEFWSSYNFHNKVVTFYLSCLPPSQHALVLERLRYAMPNNTVLGLRLLHQEWQDGNIEHLKFQARMLSSNAPKCLVRLLYQQALQNLPLCAALWKDRLLFEAAEGGKTDKLRKLVDKCQELGVSLSESLNLGLGRTQGEHQ